MLIRIIPADAGSTYFKFLSLVCQRDHPRGCGEHPLGTRVFRAMIGSSPRMRGALDGITVQALQPGIIPADAGSTSLRVYSDA